MNATKLIIFYRKQYAFGKGFLSIKFKIKAKGKYPQYDFPFCHPYK